MKLDNKNHQFFLPTGDKEGSHLVILLYFLNLAELMLFVWEENSVKVFSGKSLWLDSAYLELKNLDLQCHYFGSLMVGLLHWWPWCFWTWIILNLCHRKQEKYVSKYDVNTCSSKNSQIHINMWILFLTVFQNFVKHSRDMSMWPSKGTTRLFRVISHNNLYTT